GSGTSYARAWVGQMEATAPTSGASIATGYYPRNHGLVGLEWSRPGSGQVQIPTQAQQVQTGSLDQILQSHGVVSLAQVLKSSAPGAHVASIGGAGCASASAAGTWAADYVVCPARRHHHWTPHWVTGHAPPPGS